MRRQDKDQLNQHLKRTIVGRAGISIEDRRAQSRQVTTYDAFCAEL